MENVQYSLFSVTPAEIKEAITATRFLHPSELQHVKTEDITNADIEKAVDEIRVKFKEDAQYKQFVMAISLVTLTMAAERLKGI